MIHRSRFRVQGLEFRACSLDFKGLGVGVSGSGSRV
jgi:hypothetical protein